MAFFLGVPTKLRRSRTPLEKARLSPELLARAGCQACPLHRLEYTLRSPKMKPTGDAHPDIYICGESPGKNEDEQAEQFVGKSGDYLRRRLNPDFTYRFNNALRCRPPNNRTPEPVELGCCFPKQISDIVATKPKVILALGAIAMQELIGKSGITIWRGRAVALHLSGHSCWVVPTFHPAFLIRMQQPMSLPDVAESEYDLVFIRDLQLAESLVMRQPPNRDLFDRPDGEIKSLYQADEIVAALDRIVAQRWTATDIETRNYRPYANTSVWLTAAVATEKAAFAFPIAHPETNLTIAQQKKVKQAYLHYLQRNRVFVHNAAFEGEWFVHEFGVDQAYSYYLEDTMAQAFILDERQGVLSLGDLSIQYFGVKMKQLAHLDKMRLDQESLVEVLRYNGRDALFTLKLARQQDARLHDEGLSKIYRIQNARAMALTLAQHRGITPNEKQLIEFRNELTNNLRGLETKIADYPEISLWENATKRPFKPGSPRDVLDLFKRNELVPQDTKSADEEMLNEIDHPLARDLLEFRKTTKLYGTYVEPLILGTGKQVHDDGMVHPRFSHLVTSTGRLSSQEPNAQNLPKRGGGVRYRNVIRSRDHHKLVAIDYGQIEYRVIGMATRDKAVCDSIWKGTDAHAYWARRLLERFPRIAGGRTKAKDEKVFKEFRARVKNQWTFPAFYGSGVTNIAAAFGLSPNELEPLFEEFWEMFAGVKQWQRRLKSQADRNGYVACLNGRRRRMPMSYNAVINTPIQGTASDIVIDGMERLSRYSVDEKQPWLQPVLNVHDDLTFDLPDSDQLDDMVTFIAREMLDCRFSFINVPLTVEVSVGDTWGAMQEVAIISSLDYGIEPPALRRAA